jgi:hypothetical protein
LSYYRYLPPVAQTVDNLLWTASGIPEPHFALPPAVRPPPVNYLNNFGYNSYPFGATYDTWSVSYERDGIDQLGTGSYDLQTNGVDDNGDGVVDDVGERETVPPYSQPLRGLRVRIRMYEPSSRQIRQATVETDFLRE